MTRGDATKILVTIHAYSFMRQGKAGSSAADRAAAQSRRAVQFLSPRRSAIATIGVGTRLVQDRLEVRPGAAEESGRPPRVLWTDEFGQSRQTAEQHLSMTSLHDLVRRN